MIAFVVPGAPQGKGRAKIVKIGGFSRMATPQKTVAYEGLVAHAAAQAMAGRPLLDGPCVAQVLIACAVPASWSQRKQRMALAGELMPTTKPDADNVIKALFDGCNGVLWRDDVQVVDLTVSKRYAAVPCVQMQVRPVLASQQQELAA